MNNPFPPGALVAAYLRDSGGESQDKSIEEQAAAVRQFCQAHGLVLTTIYADAATPGTSTAGRDQFHAMISHFRNKAQEAGVVIWKFNRFARSIDDAQFYRADLRRRGYIIHSLNDTIPTGIDGKFFEAAIDWMNERFIEDLSIDVRRGLRYIVETYGAMPGTPPRGFMRVPVQVGARRDGKPRILHRWEPDPLTAPLAARAFAMCAAGATLEAISAATGLYISKNSWQTFFNNTLYYGELRFGDLTIPDYCAPIIDRATWESANAMRARRNKSGPAHLRRQSGAFLLSGLLFCQLCGAPMNAHIIKDRGGTAREYYKCSRRHRRRDCHAPEIPRREIETKVIENLRERIITPDHIAALEQEIEAQRQQTESTLEQTRLELTRNLSTVEKKLTNLAAAIAEHGPSAALLEQLKTNERIQTELRSHLSSQTNINNQPAMTAQEIEILVQLLQENLSNESETRQTLRRITARIIAVRQDKKTTAVIYYYPPKLWAYAFGSVPPNGRTLKTYSLLIS